jgi:hypothetical protein
MRNIRLSGREARVVRVIGFAEGMMGAEIQDNTHMDAEDVTDTLNSLISAGFVEPVPYRDQIEMAEMSTMCFEVNAAYMHELRGALRH